MINTKVKNQLVGTWRLLSYEIQDTEGQVSYPYGQDAIGYLVYTHDGFMSATLTNKQRPRFISEDPIGGSLEEKAQATQTYLAYCGRYEIQDNQVVHHIEASLFPNWIGVDQQRFFEFEKDRLLLKTPPLLVGGKRRVAYLIWERYLIV
ncbi:lipocalin-like domain-containing protein [Nostoc sp. UHCC 0251]|uniref:lipocalin-like domain-containing protein n=1 Tax=Nostoc sp. UHCC 0251 TaxID=3110240 RepID=UPI002B20DBB0|nr:lipocalin-like domain-containing protein [Nostoc sp. UHCC 0251]MEA5621831.1 lipocalin-like domain-containing protein [Nostoc sp. UHCC 0251]